jgi:periplasmic divalent cation tolerance protein
VLCTTPDLKSAKKIAHKAVKKTTAACCNIIQNVISVYSWESKINEDDECLLIFKTSKEKYKKLEKMILKNHPYDLPEIISLAIEEGYPKYLDWVLKSTR